MSMLPFAVGFGLLILLIILRWPSAPLRKRVEPAPQPPKPDGWDDRGYAAAHGLTLPQWAALTPKKKAELRLSAAHGKGWPQ